MAVYGDKSYTNFTGVNLRNTAAIRLEMDGGFAGTIGAKVGAEASRAWTLPDKTGVIPIMGTFAVQIPAGVAAFFSTAVTVTGIRVEDALVAQLNENQGYNFDNSTAYVLISATPRNGSVLLSFNNPGNATGYVELGVSYLVMR